MENVQELNQERQVEKEDRKPKDYLTYLITVQSVLCIILFLAMFGFSKMGGDNYKSFKSQIETIMSYDMGISGIKDAFNKVVDFVMAPSNQWKGDSLEKSTDTTKEAIPQKGGIGSPDSIFSNTFNPTNTSFAPYSVTVGAYNPVEGGKLSSKFGFRKDPFTKKMAFHGGMDISAKEGTRIAAAYNGTVKKVGKHDKAGNYILLKHEGGLETFYCHCKEVLVKEGTVIRAGETIATIGSTGNSTGPHLHFEIRINGVKYNPLNVLKEYK